MDEPDTHPWERTFVENMIRTRKQQGLSQTEMAKRASARGLAFHQQTIQRIEQGVRPVRLNEAMVLADILLMDDLMDAITPKSEDRALSMLRAANTDSSQALSEGRAVIEDLAEDARAHADDLQADRDSYVRLASSLGADISAVQHSGPVVHSDSLVRRWQEVADLLDFTVLWSQRPHGDGENDLVTRLRTSVWKAKSRSHIPNALVNLLQDESDGEHPETP